MSRDLINRNEDLSKLHKAGYKVQILGGGYLLIHSVPYVTKEGQVKHDGVLASVLFYSGQDTIKPTDHVAWFIGECPHTHDGKQIKVVINNDQKVFADGVVATNTLSAKADYKDHYEKMTRYINIISSHAQVLDSDAKAEIHEVYEHQNEDSVFVYPDTNSARALINPITDKLKGQKIAIIGTGGTGSYILDLVAKTPVSEIHLFDGDPFLQHNAFRAPGATSLDKLYEHPTKVDYYAEIYSHMHKYITPHPYNITSENVSELREFSFVFISIDACPEKKDIVTFLEENEIPFIDTGIGVQDIDGALKGQVRVTTSIPGKRDHVHKRVSFGKTDDDIYDQNIQIADLNALNAAFAVIKWKKLMGFYKDCDKELHSSYVSFVNEIVNDEI